MRRKILALVLAFIGLTYVGYIVYQREKAKDILGPQPTLSKVVFGVSPFQDTLIPIVGGKKGWYREDGLDVEFKILGWAEVMEALSAGQVDVAINNDSSIISTHERNPKLVYWYGLNPFDNGFALMIHADGKLKTLQQIEKEVGDHELAVKMTAAQLKGKTVITTGNTDMEQGVAAAARRGGIDFKKDVRIIDVNPDEGLAAFLRGDGDAYIGGIPQRTRANKEGMLEMLTGADLGPPPINGIVTTKGYAKTHQNELLKLLHVWFKTVNHINRDMEDGAGVIIKELNSYTGAQFTLEDFRKFWNNYEHFPANPGEVQELILDRRGRNYWKARWDDSNTYFYAIVHTIPKPVDAEGVFLMPEAQERYVEKYGWH